MNLRCWMLILSLSLFACQRWETPDATQIRILLRGTYCAYGPVEYQLVLGDSTYHNVRRRPGILQETVKITEQCQGRYTLITGEKKWEVHFYPDPDPQTVFENCEATLTVWQRGKGLLLHSDSLRIPELFDGVLVEKNACSSQFPISPS